MGQLARHLQNQFVARTPRGWTCAVEERVLDGQFETLLGHAPQADVLLASNDGRFRLWVEFEVSRADPVANHAKFATAHLFRPQKPTDTFDSMMSTHVARGRRNLATNTVLLMRRIGMKAFQAVLLPTFGPNEIKRLNTDCQDLSSLHLLDVDAEIDRALAVASPCFDSDLHQIHFVGKPPDVACNVATWNREMQTDFGRQLWGHRRLRYFVFDPSSGEFAPSKFCAFLNATHGATSDAETMALPMTMDLYVSLDESERQFDGNRAQRYLTNWLGLVENRARGISSHRTDHDDELQEIRRLWRLEKHEFDDAVPRIHLDAVVEEFPIPADDDNLLRGEDWQILKDVCRDDPMFFELQSSLLDVEREFRGMSRRAGIYEALEDRFKACQFESEQEALEVLQTEDELRKEADHRMNGHWRLCSRSCLKRRRFRLQVLGAWLRIKTASGWA